MESKNAIRILENIGIELSKFPQNIELSFDGNNILTMMLLPEVLGLGTGKAINMQDDAAAFEAWALIIKAKAKKKNFKLILDVKGVCESDYDAKKPSNGCLGRFLYRILKFSDQYKEWFALSNILDDFKKKFVQYLSGKHTFKNNVPNGESETDEDKLWNKGLEKYVEWMLCTKDGLRESVLRIDKETVINRQLPVGLFEDEVKRDNVVFTGGTSAIDFWALDDKEKTINIYELKTKNNMVGILTEIFFYSNYVNDTFVK